MRWLIFVFLVFNLVLVGISAMSLDLSGQRLLGLSFGYSVMMAFALLFLSYWVWKDGEELDNLYNELGRLRRKIRESS